MDNHPPNGRAALTGRTDSAEYDSSDRQIQIRTGGNNDAVIAAQFEDCLAQTGCNGLRNMPSHSNTAGCRDQWDASILDQFLANFFTVTDYQVKNTIRQAVFF